MPRCMPWRVRPAAEAQPDLLGNPAHKYLVVAAVFALYALDWGLARGPPDHTRNSGCLGTEAAILATAGALFLCFGLLLLWLQKLARGGDWVELHRLVVAGRLRDNQHLVLRGGLAVADGLSGRWLLLYQRGILLLFASAVARFLCVGRCSQDGLPMLLLLYEVALWILSRDGQSETLLAPLLTMGVKWVTGLRDVDQPGVMCLGFMERTPLPFSTLHGLHSGMVAILAPGLPEYAQVTAVAYLAFGTIEHWLRHWDAVAAHRTLMASGKGAILQGLLIGNGDTVSIWEGALLSLLLYLTSGVVASGIWLYTRHQAELVLVQQALKDTEHMQG